MELSFYKTMLDSLYDGVYFVDKDRKIIYWNASAESLTGYSANDIIGCYCYDNKLNHANNEGVLLCKGESCPLAKTLKDGSLREEELYLQHKDGHRIPIAVRISPIRNAKNEIIGAVEVFNDNSCKSHLLEQLAQFKELCLIDSLTGLGNKRYVEIELAAKLNEMHNVGRPFFGVLFADIDHFKRVNDQYGHDTGDKIIKMVAKTIQNSVGNEGIAFRWGGEEFLAIINTHLKEELVKVSERVRALTEQSIFRRGLDEIRVTVSVGATLAELNDTDEMLVKRADELLYISKKTGRNKVMVF
jgi:diguanylate cyclase (GGDEF)-like protein/PAS domain S-box-containing protein